MLLVELETTRGKIYKDVCTLAVQILSTQEKLVALKADLESLEKSAVEYQTHLKELKRGGLVSMDLYKKMCYTIETHLTLLEGTKETYGLAKAKLDGLEAAKKQLEGLVAELDLKILKAQRNVLVFQRT